MEKTIKPQPIKRGALRFDEKRKRELCVCESSLHDCRSGFAIAPILYLLALAGVASGVLFSNISQVLRSNINVTNATTAKNDIAGAITTLSATAKLSADLSRLCPPTSAAVSADCTVAPAVPEKLVLFDDVAAGDLSKRPVSYAIADDSGSPYETGVFAAAAGIKQLDPWGHFYVYCRWENPRATADAPAIKVISAGANATLETKCGDDTAKGDDQMNSLTVGTAIQRAAVWQDTGSSVEYGQTGNKVSVSDLGVITATGLIVNTATFGELYLTSPLPIVSGGTGASTAATARVNLGSGTTGDSLFLATTATGARNTLGATSIGHYLFAGSSLVADTASAARLGLLGASAVGNDLFVAVDAAAGRGVLGATAMGDYLFSSGAYVAATATAVRTTLLGAGAIGDAVFLSGDVDTAQTALGASVVGKAVFMAASAAAGRTALGGGAVGSPLFTAADQATAWNILGLTGTSGTLNVDITGEAGSVDGANITGTVPIAHGGTSSGTASGALDNLFGGDSAPTTALNVGRIGANSLDSGKLTNVVAAGTYNQVDVDSAGRVTSGTVISPNTDHISDGVGDSIYATATNGGMLIFSTASNEQMALTATGSLGLGTIDPAEKLHIFGGNARIAGPSDGYRELQFATSTNSKRWVVAADDSTETGSGDTGSDFVIRRYSDAGVAATVLNIDRATGGANFAGSVAATGGFLGYFTGTFDGTYIGTISGSVLLGTDATHANPQRPSDATTGLFSGAAQTVSVATAGTQRLIVTATGSVGIGTATPAQALDVTGNVNVSTATGAYYIANTKILHEPAGDTTSIGVGYGTLANQTATNLGNTAVGRDALATQTVAGGGAGKYNAAYGYQALTTNTASGNAAGSYNNAIGYQALQTNTASGLLAGSNNNAIGHYALAFNTASGINAGSANVAIGSSALAFNTASGTAAGGGNVAIGGTALFMNTGIGNSAGRLNVAIGSNALFQNTGSGNTAIGSLAMGKAEYDVDGNVISPPYTGSFNTVLGYGVASTTLVSGSSNILIGTSSAVDTPAAATSNWLNIGNTIYGDLSLGSVAIGAAAVTSGTSLDLSSRTDSLLLPKGTTLQEPVGVEGMIRYNNDTHAFEGFAGSTPAWGSLASGSGSSYLGADSTHTSPSRSDDVTTGLFSDAASTVSVATAGTQRLIVTATGSVGIGTATPAQELSVAGDINVEAITNAYYIAGTKTMFQPASDTTSFAVGPGALATQTATNLKNTAVGYQALNKNTTLGSNTAVGYQALYKTTTGNNNTAVGYWALDENTTGYENTAVGSAAMDANTSGTRNTAMGTGALKRNLTGGSNISIGYGSMGNNKAGSGNIAIGTDAMRNMATSSAGNNVAIGGSTLNYVAGVQNTAVGYNVLSRTTTYTGNYNVALGIGVGSTTLTSGSSNILIGTSAAVDVPAAATSNWLNIGNTIYGDLSLGSVAIGAAAVTSGVTLDLSGRTDSLLVPKGTAGQQPAGVEGMIRYNIDTHAFEGYSGSTPGWTDLGSSGLPTNYLGETTAGTSPRRSDDLTTGLFSDVAAQVSTAISGTERLRVTATGIVAYGSVAINDITGAYSIAGIKVLHQPASDTTSVGVGPSALVAQTVTNAMNTALGYQTLYNTTTGTKNVAVGYRALRANTTASQNVAIGYLALDENQTSSSNVAIGPEALSNLESGNGDNVAVGYWALRSATTGYSNVAIGKWALTELTGGSYNVAVGGSGITTGRYNSLLGYGSGAGSTGDNNTVLGYNVGSTTLATGSSNILIGNSNAVDVPTSSTSNFLNIGGVINASMASQLIGLNLGTTIASYPLQVGSTSGNGNGAYLTAAGVWTNASDRRIKENIRTVPYGLDTLMKLKPVAYEMVGSHDKQIGFIAQDVGDVIPEVVSVSREGRYGLSYGNMVAVVVKAMQEMKGANDNQAATLAALVEENKKLRAELERVQVSGGGVQAGKTPDDTRALLMLTIKVGGAVGLLLVFGLGACGVALWRRRSAA